MSALSTLDIAVIAAYFLLMIWLGARFKKHQKDTHRYFLGRRDMPGWAVGMSMFATIVSSWTFIALPGKAFASDLQYLVNVLILPLCALFAARVLIPLFRERIRLSAYEFLERRFGLPARIYGNLAFLIVHFGKMAAILYLLSLTVAGITGWNIFLLILLIGLATLFYTFHGGIEGVVWSEVIQGFLLIAGGLLSLAFIFFTFPHGADRLLAETVAAGKFRLFSFEVTPVRLNTVLLVFFGLNYWMQKYVSDQTVVQRYLLAASPKSAVRAIWMSSLLIIFIWVLFMSIGALLWTFYRLQPGLLPASVAAYPDRVYPHFIGHQLPSGLTGVVLSALLAATMSTLSSDLNAVGSVLYDDYYTRLGRGGNEQQRLRICRFMVLVAGLLCVLLAMAFTRVQSMADAAFDFVALAAGGILGMYLLGIYTRRTSPVGLYIGLGSAVAAVLYLHLSSNSAEAAGRGPLIHTLWLGLIGNLITLVVGYLASRILTPRYVAASHPVTGKMSTQPAEENPS